MRERVLLACAVALVAAGALAAALVDTSASPSACVRRVADRLGYDLTLDLVVDERDDGSWTSTVPVDGELVLQVAGEDGRVTAVTALAGHGADVLERPARLEALAVRC